MPKTDDSVWSFNLRSYNPCDFSDPDSDREDVLIDNPCSDGSTLVDHLLSEDNDTAVYKPNPWSIARINAASRAAQKSPQRNNDIVPNKTTTKCDKKQPQGRIVDLLKKQAQQPPSDTCPGLRLLETSRSSGANKPGENSKKPDPTRFRTATPTNGRPSGYTGKAVKDTHQLRGATRDKCPVSAVGRIPSTKAVTSSLPSDPSADRGRKRVIRNSANTRSNLLSRPARVQTSSTHASVDQSIGLFPDVVDSGPLGSWGHSADPPGTQSSQAIPAKTPITCASPRGPASSKGPSIGVPHTHHLSDKQSAFPNEISQTPHMGSPTQSIPVVPPSRPEPGLPRPTHQPRHDALASHAIPAVSLSQCEPDEPSETVSVHSQAVHPSLPTPELIDAFSPAPRKWESAYDHPALQLPADDDNEWSTLPRRKPGPRKRPKDPITNSAKFSLPIWSRGRSPKNEAHGERMEKRPRITLYRPPPRTVNVDLTGIESRYACVRDAIRKYA